MAGQLNSSQWILVFPLVGAVSTMAAGLMIPNSPVLLYTVGGTIAGFLIAISRQNVSEGDIPTFLGSADVPDDYPLSITVQDAVTSNLVAGEATVRAEQTDLEVMTPDAEITTTTENGTADLSISSWGEWQLAVDYGDFHETTTISVRKPTEHVVEVGPRSVHVEVESTAETSLAELAVSCETDHGPADQLDANPPWFTFGVPVDATEATITARAEGHSPATETVAVDDSPANVTLTLEPAAANVTTTVTCNDQPFRNTPLVLTTDEDVQRRATTDQDGTATFEEVPSGAHDVDIDHPELSSFYDFGGVTVDGTENFTTEIAATFSFDLSDEQVTQIDRLRTRTSSAGVAATTSSSAADAAARNLLDFAADLPDDGAAVATVRVHPDHLINAILDVTSTVVDDFSPVAPTVDTDAALDRSTIERALAELGEDPTNALGSQLTAAAKLNSRVDGVGGRAASIEDGIADLRTFLENAEPDDNRADAVARGLLGHFLLTVVEEIVDEVASDAQADQPEHTSSQASDHVAEATRQPPASVPASPNVTVTEADLANTPQEQIAETQHTVVSRVSLPSTNSSVAVKEPHSPSGKEVLAEQVSAIDDWAAINDHDHIAAVHGAGNDDAPWIAIEYMDGGPLRDRLRGNNGPLPVAEAVWITRAIADALNHAHSQRVHHLNITPENILFRTTTGEAWSAPKISDFDVAGLAREPTDSPMNLPLGYAAPEQLDSDTYGTPGEKTDVYQLGAVLYELVTGVQAFSPHPSTGRVTTDLQPPNPAEENPEIPAALSDICTTAMSVEQSGRFESMADLRDALDNLYERL
jgi:hypothetical protein